MNKNNYIALALAVAFLFAANVRADLYSGYDLFVNGYEIYNNGYGKNSKPDSGSWDGTKRPVAADDEHIYGFTATWSSTDWSVGDFAQWLDTNLQINGYESGQGLWKEYTPDGFDAEPNTLYFMFDLDEFIKAVAANNEGLTFAITNVSGVPLNSNVWFTAWQYPPPPATPEPATLAVLGLGLVGLGLVRARRKK